MAGGISLTFRHHSKTSSLAGSILMIQVMAAERPTHFGANQVASGK